jgi:hypothetical protein
MKYFDGVNGDNKEDEFQRVPEFMRASAYLDRRQQQILQSEEEIIGFQHAIGNLMLDIAHLLAATPSAGNQAILQRSFGELEGLANAVAQAAAAAPSGGDPGANRGANVDLPGIQAAIESRANVPGGSASKDSDYKTRKKGERLKELSDIDPAAVSGTDQNAPGDAKQAADAPSDTKPTATDKPLSNLDRFNKLTLAESHTQDDPAASAASDLPSLPTKRGSRSYVAALKLDHAETVAKSDAPDAQVAAQGVEATAQAGSATATAQPIHKAAVRKPPSPGGW